MLNRVEHGIRLLRSVPELFHACRGADAVAGATCRADGARVERSDAGIKLGLVVVRVGGGNSGGCFPAFLSRR